MGEEVNKSCRDDDSSTELFQDDKNNIVIADKVELPGQNWGVDTDSTCDQDDEEKPDSKTNVVVTIRGFAYWPRTSANAVGNTSVFVAMLTRISRLT